MSPLRTKKINVQHDTPQSRFVLEYPMGIDDVTYEMLLELTHEVK